MAKSAFIDEVEINVAGGSGGNGIVSFLRERARPFGGPNGGNGGSGGSIILQATHAVNTLSAFRYKRNIRAANGKGGGGGNCHGANADDIILPVPLGTRVIDAGSGYLHADLICADDTALLASGGRGGYGNAHFKSSTNRAPRTATKGKTGEERCFRLELKIVADVGLLGLPNAGKSTFLRAVSAARPRVASYPFTTLEPQLGWVELEQGHGALIIADIPGIIRGAADGAGLGNRFLRHLARSVFLCQIVDATSPTLFDDCRDLQHELQRAADSDLIKKPRWLLLNKIDMLAADERQQLVQQLHDTFDNFEQICALSALTGEGVRECVQLLLARQVS